MGLGLLALSGIYIAAKKGLFGHKNNINAPINSNNDIADNLGYAIKPPKINDISLPSDFGTNEIYSRYNSEDFPLEKQYWKVLEDIKRDSNTNKRYKEVADSLNQTANKINNELAKYRNEIIQKNTEFGASEFENEYGTRFSINTERGITQKRYFSLPENQSADYCSKDPLLYKEAREEIIDTYLGYTLLTPIQAQSKRQGSPVVDILRKAYPINNDDNKFVDECISRMIKNDKAVPYGKNSAFHAYELAHLGKIFRQALGIETV